MKTSSHFALVAAAGFLVGGMMLTPVKAADLGGDCCADLEERVAELEATTARKGNRVMGVTITGRVDQALLWQSNSLEEDDIAQVDNGTRFRIEGSGSVRPGLKVGYRIQLGVASTASTPSVGDVYWFAESDVLGRLTMGKTSGASDNIGNVNLGGSIFDGSGASTVGAAYGNAVRWDSPTFANVLGISVGWVEDDAWSVAAIYSQEFNGIKIAATVNYEVDDTPDNKGPGNALTKTRASGSVLHVPSGLYFTANWGNQERDSGIAAGQHFYLHSGVAKDFTGIGTTDIYGEWGHSRDFGPDQTFWGFGYEQGINSVSSTAYLHYGTVATDDGSDDVSKVIAGLRVNF